MGRLIEMIVNSFSQIVDSKSNAALITDVERRIVCVNQKLESLFGYSQESLIGQILEVLLPEQYREGHPVFFDRYVESPEAIGSGSGLTLWGLHQNGTEFQIDTKLQILEVSEKKYVLCEVLEV